MTQCYVVIGCSSSHDPAAPRTAVVGDCQYKTARERLLLPILVQLDARDGRNLSRPSIAYNSYYGFIIL